MSLATDLALDGRIAAAFKDRPKSGDVAALIKEVEAASLSAKAAAAIAPSRVGSYPCAARATVPAECPLAHIQGRSGGATGTLKMRPTTTPSSSTS